MARRLAQANSDADPVDVMAGDDEHLGRHVGATGNAAIYPLACLQVTKLRAWPI
jgi:hypothetical protein